MNLNIVQFNWYTFSELSVASLYEVLALRSAIFVVDQHCPYQDVDGRDPFALHLLGTDDGKLCAYLRLFPPTSTESYLVFGRVITAQWSRNLGYGKRLMQALLDYCAQQYPGTSIHCSAQYYLKKFYESFGFTACGDAYEEDGILHIAMKK